MYETPITVVGTVLTDPNTRETQTGTMTTFRIASTARRRNKDDGQWGEGDSVYLTVLCWKSLSANIRQSVHKGDPVVVSGTLRTRQYQHEGQERSAYELLANNVGHDLARGTAEFRRNKPVPQTHEVDDGSREALERAEADGGGSDAAAADAGERADAAGPGEEEAA